MNRLAALFLFLLLSCTGRILNKNLEREVSSLYFGVDVFRSPDQIIDYLRNQEYLAYNDTVLTQSDWQANLILETDEDAWSSRYRFRFTRSPIPGQSIRSGEIVVELVETAGKKALRNLTATIYFDNSDDCETFYAQLKQRFAPFSALLIQKDEEKGLVNDHYSMRKTGGITEKTVSFYFSNPIQNMIRLVTKVF